MPSPYHPNKTRNPAKKSESETSQRERERERERDREREREIENRFEALKAVQENFGVTSLYKLYMGGCQNDGPVVDPYYDTATNIQGTQKRDHTFDNHPYGPYTTDPFEGVRPPPHLPPTFPFESPLLVLY